jgi:hypothetical protein
VLLVDIRYVCFKIVNIMMDLKGIRAGWKHPQRGGAVLPDGTQPWGNDACCCEEIWSVASKGRTDELL